VCVCERENVCVCVSYGGALQVLVLLHSVLELVFDEYVYMYYVSVCACERERMCVYICHLAGP